MRETINVFGYEGVAFTQHDALQRMHEILEEPYPLACRELATEIGEFLGEHFLLTIHPSLPEQLSRGITFVYAGQHPEKVHIRLVLNSGRVAESLVHELLHVELLRRGFPWTNSDLSRKVHERTFNHIHHELIFPLFAGLGLDPRKLCSPYRPSTNIDILAHLERPEYDFSWWCREWLADWQTWRHTGADAYKAWELEVWGKVLERYPTLDETLHRIEEWFARGDYHDPVSFERVYNELVVAMGMPPEEDTEWFRLKKGNGRLQRHYNELS